MPMPDPPPVTTAVCVVNLARTVWRKFSYAPIFPFTLKRLGMVKSIKTYWSKKWVSRGTWLPDMSVRSS